VLDSRIDLRSPEFRANADAMQGLVDFLVAECCADEVGCKNTQTAA